MSNLRVVGTAFSVLVTVGVVVGVLYALRHSTMMVGSEGMVKECKGQLNGMACTFTNVGALEARECVVGVLKQNGNSALTIKSLPMCSGIVKYQDVADKSVPWVGGNAATVCKSSGLGLLDWDVCTFDLQAYPEK